MKTRSLCALVRQTERGFILPMVLIMLAVGALVLVPALSLGITGMKTQQVTEWKTLEMYDADAGVEEAVRWLHYDGRVGYGWTEDSPSPVGVWSRTSLEDELNGSDVDVTVEEVSTNVYRVTSTATGEDTSTKVVAYVVLDYADFSFLLDSAITSGGSLEITGPSEVLGDIVYSPDGINGPPPYYPPEPWDITQEEMVWPDADLFSAWYLAQFSHMDPPPPEYAENHTVYLAGSTEANPVQLGPARFYKNLTIQGPGYLRLTGTVYVEGIFDIKSSAPGVTLDLDLQTIFVNHYDWPPSAINTPTITIPTGTTLRDSGCIIGRYDITCNPMCQAEGDEDQYVLLMSCDGEVDLNPLGVFSGSIVGNANVDLANGTIVWVDPTDSGINFPIGEGEAGEPGSTLTVPSYVIS